MLTTFSAIVVALAIIAIAVIVIRAMTLRKESNDPQQVQNFNIAAFLAIVVISAVVALALGATQAKYGLRTTLQLASSFLVFAVIIAVSIWNAAKEKFLWAFVPRNKILLTDMGPGNPYKVLGIRPKMLSWFGIYWIGFPPATVHLFPLVHERVNKEMGPNTDSDKWIIRDPEAVLTDYLERNVTHWVKVPGVEFKGGQRADILFEYQATFVTEEDARVAVYDRGGKFYDSANSVFHSATISVCGTMTYEEFMNAREDANSDFCKGIRNIVNETATKLSGLTIDLTFVYRFDASSTAEAKLARAKQQAEIEAEAAKLAAKGKVADIDEAIKSIKEQLPDADPTTIVEVVGRIAAISRLSEMKNLQAIGGAMLGLTPDENSSEGKPPRRGKKK